MSTSEKPMKKNVVTKGQAIAVATLIATMGVTGCELLVDFDRTLIDSGTGLPDGSINDASIDATGDQSVADSPTTDSPTTDSPTETGTDGGMDTSTTDTGTDAHDGATETGTEAGTDAGPEAGLDAAMEAEAASAASLTLTAATTAAFGNQDVGAAANPDLTFTVTNTGGTASSAVTINVTGSGFVLTAGQDNCTGASVTANNGTCTFKVHFTPSSDGAKTGSASASASTGGNPSIALSGVGKGLVIAPTPHDYGTVTSGGMGTSQTYTVTNNASVTSGMLTTTKGGTDPTQFTLGTDTCNGNTVASGMTCTVDANFTPTATLAKSATITVSATGVGGSAVATLTGTGN